jgi:hypothetical protein
MAVLIIKKFADSERRQDFPNGQEVFMLFLTYWELNENMPESERLGLAKKLTSSGLFPPKGVKVLRWDETPDSWGILLIEAENAMDVALALDIWRMGGAGFFKFTKTAPAFPIAESMQPYEEMLKTIALL